MARFLTEIVRTGVVFVAMVLSADVAIADQAPQPGGTSDAVSTAINLPAGPDRNTAVSAAMAEWAGKAPIDAMNYAGKITDRVLQRTALMRSCRKNDEPGALQWGMEHASGTEQHVIFGT